MPRVVVTVLLRSSFVFRLGVCSGIGYFCGAAERIVGGTGRGWVSFCSTGGNINANAFYEMVEALESPPVVALSA